MNLVLTHDAFYWKTINTLIQPDSVFVYTRHELDSELGAGLRLLKGLLGPMELKHRSIFWSQSTPRNAMSLGLKKGSIFARWRQLLQETPTTQCCLVIPDSIQDCLITLPLILLRQNTTVWIMDDFWRAETLPPFRWRAFFKKLFAKFYMGFAPKVAVISDAMLSDYSKRYNLQKALVLYPAKSSPKPSPSPSSDFSRWVYMGNIKKPYIETLEKFPIDLFMKQGIVVDIYAAEPPEAPLDNQVFHYKGPFHEANKWNLLSNYSVGLLSYSLDPNTQAHYQLSLSSKLLDYCLASLAIFYIGPASFYSHNLIKDFQAGIAYTDQTQMALSTHNLDLFKANLKAFQKRSQVLSQQFNVETLQRRLASILVDDTQIPKSKFERT